MKPHCTLPQKNSNTVRIVFVSPFVLYDPAGAVLPVELIHTTIKMRPPPVGLIPHDPTFSHDLSGTRPTPKRIRVYIRTVEFVAYQFN